MSMIGKAIDRHLMRMRSEPDPAVRLRSFERGLCDGETVAKPAPFWSRPDAEQS